MESIFFRVSARKRQFDDVQYRGRMRLVKVVLIFQFVTYVKY